MKLAICSLVFIVGCGPAFTNGSEDPVEMSTVDPAPSSAHSGENITPIAITHDIFVDAGSSCSTTDAQSPVVAVDAQSAPIEPTESCVIVHAAWSSTTTYAGAIPAVCPTNTFAVSCNCDTSGFGVIPVSTASNDAGMYDTDAVPTECRCAIGGGNTMGEVASIATCCTAGFLSSLDGGAE